MAQLKDSLITGSLRVTDTLYTTTAQLAILKAPTASNGTTYGPGSANQVLKSNGTSVYWGADAQGVTSVTLTSGTGITVSDSGTAITGTGSRTISLANNYGDTKNPYASKTQGYVLAAPSNANGAPSFRALVAADIPTLTKAKISDFSHDHGNIANGGTIGQTTNWTLASGDGLVVFDSSNSNKMERSGITFDGSTETKGLTPKGTWVNYAGGTKVTLNGTAKGASTASFYAPTGAGTNGQFLKSTGSAPEWKTFDSSDIKPLVHKLYESTSFYGGGDNYDSTTFFFMKIRPDTWYKPWKIKIKVRSYCPTHSECESVTYSLMTGRLNSYSYANWNERNDSYAHYYTSIRLANQTGFNAEQSHAFGICLRYSSNYTNSAWYRSFEVDLLETENCTVTFLDTPVLWANWPEGTSNYSGWSCPNGVDRGLCETNDLTANDDDRTFQAIRYFRYKTGAAGVGRYTLLMEESTGVYSSLTTTFPTSNTPLTTLTMNTGVKYKLGRIIYFNQGANRAANTNIGNDMQYYIQYSLIDGRYTFQYTAGALTAYKPFYMVGTLDTDGFFTIDSAATAWTQTLPTENTTKVYIYLGTVYPDTNPYRIALEPQHPIYTFTDGSLKEIHPGAISGNAATATKANLTTTTTNAIVRYSDTTGTFANSTSTINDKGTMTINGRLILNPKKDDSTQSYNEGIRINVSTNGWANIQFGGADESTSGTADGQWLAGRRGAAGSKVGAIGDFTIEEQNSIGGGLTLHKDSGGVTLYSKLAYDKSQLKIWNDNSIAANKTGWAINAVSTMAATSRSVILIGAANSSKNQAYIGFYYAGSGLDTNYLTLGLYGADDLVKIFPTGQVSVTKDTDSSSTSTGSFIVAGGAGIAKNLYVGTCITVTNTNATNHINFSRTGGHSAPNYINVPASSSLAISVGGAGGSNIVAMIDPEGIVPFTTNTKSIGTSTYRWASLYIGTADTYGDAYLPIYWNSGVPTYTNGVLQKKSFSFANNTTTVVLEDVAYNQLNGIETFVMQIVVTSGEEYLNSPITWVSAQKQNSTTTGQITLSCTSATTGVVNGYIVTARGINLDPAT